MEYRSIWIELGSCTQGYGVLGQGQYPAGASSRNQALHRYYQLETCCNCDVPSRQKRLGRLAARIKGISHQMAGRAPARSKSALSLQLPLGK